MTARPVCPYCKAELPPPPSSADPNAPHAFSTCPTCTATHPPTYVVGDRSGLLDLLLHEYKYDSLRALGIPLAELLDARLPAFPGPVCLVPLPTATHHIRSRGFDHTYKLARHLAHLRGYRVQPLLLRARNTTQVGANKNARLTQAATAYQLDPRAHLDSTTYLLLDDISTTGASITAATKKLLTTDLDHGQLAIALLAVSLL